MSNPRFSNLGALCKSIVSATASAVAGGAGDNTETNGAVVDRQQSELSALGTGSSLAQGAKLLLCAHAVLAEDKTAVFKPTIQHGDESDGSDMADVDATLQPEGAAASTCITLTGEAGGSTERDEYEHNFDCTGLKRYLRAQVLVDCDAAATDTAFYTAAFVLSGFAVTPVS